MPKVPDRLGANKMVAFCVSPPLLSLSLSLSLCFSLSLSLSLSAWDFESSVAGHDLAPSSSVRYYKQSGPKGHPVLGHGLELGMRKGGRKTFGKAKSFVNLKAVLRFNNSWRALKNCRFITKCLSPARDTAWNNAGEQGTKGWRKEVGTHQAIYAYVERVAWALLVRGTKGSATA
jgi:hypothetical protein